MSIDNENNFPIIIFVKDVSLNEAIKLIKTPKDIPNGVPFIVLQTRGTQQDVNTASRVVGLTVDEIRKLIK